MTPKVKRDLLQRGQWIIEYRSSGCNDFDCTGRDGAVISVRPWNNQYPWVHWHAKRFFGRNRTTVELVRVALDWVLAQEAAERRAHADAELAAEEATALSEVLAEMAAIEASL